MVSGKYAALARAEGKKVGHGVLPHGEWREDEREDERGEDEGEGGRQI